MKKKHSTKKVFEPFKNPYEGNIFLDPESICSEKSDIKLDGLSLDKLVELSEEIRENIADWEDILYDDMTSYQNSNYMNSSKDDVASDRRHVQTLKVELREIKKRIRMMMNNTNERELIVA